jgi:thymidylate synthase (FAD)
LQVNLIDKMGTDLTVVNAARVSFAKESEWESIPEAGPITGLLHDKDEKLISFLARHNHWSPFAHCSLQFRIKAPIFVARQLVKHQVGLSWNEVSRRYVDYEPEFYIPDTWRGRPLNSKQGSDGEVPVDNSKYDNMMSQLKLFYETLLNQGVAPEMARMVLPQSMMTEWYWSGTLYAFARVCNLRCASDTQEETRVVADLIDKLTQKSFPVSWKYLRNETK